MTSDDELKIIRRFEYPKKLNMRFPLFSSLFMHALFLAYILSLPLYAGNFDAVSFDFYPVFLSGESDVERAAPALKAALPLRMAPLIEKTREVVQEEEAEIFPNKAPVAEESADVPATKELANRELKMASVEQVMPPPMDDKPKEATSEIVVEKKKAREPEKAAHKEKKTDPPVENKKAAEPPKKTIPKTEPPKPAPLPEPVVKTATSDSDEKAADKAGPKPVELLKEATKKTLDNVKHESEEAKKSDEKIMQKDAERLKGREHATSEKSAGGKETEKLAVNKAAPEKVKDGPIPGTRTSANEKRSEEGKGKASAKKNGIPASSGQRINPEATAKAKGSNPSMLLRPAMAGADKRPGDNFASAKKGSEEGALRGIAEKGSEKKGTERVEEEKIPFGIPNAKALLTKDINIYISPHNGEVTGFAINLLKSAHPSFRKKGGQIAVEGLERDEEPLSSGKGKRQVLGVTKAEKGLYIFTLRNGGGVESVCNLEFHIYKGKAGERIREVKNAKLPSNSVLKYKFILPEAIFWDDDSRFTGRIESSDAMTKFDDRTGLVWKEEKEY